MPATLLAVKPSSITWRTATGSTNVAMVDNSRNNPA